MYCSLIWLLAAFVWNSTFADRVQSPWSLLQKQHVLGPQHSVLLPEATASAPAAITGSYQSKQETQYGNFHEIVGQDGALMISLMREPSRAQFATEQFSKVSIVPTFVPAVDGSTASHEALAAGCEATSPMQFNSTGGELEDGATCATRPSRIGQGCGSPAEQAIAASHRRALEMALERKENWTAIFEDDAVPVVHDLASGDAAVRWNSEFMRSWAELPPGVLMVRLGWCLAPLDQHDKLSLQDVPTGSFLLSYPNEAYYGGCTSAYMVHKKVIPQLLALFPCCGALDAVYEFDFAAKAGPGGGKPRSFSMIMDMDVAGSVELIRSRNLSDDIMQRGVFMQERGRLPSMRTAPQVELLKVDIATKGKTNVKVARRHK